MRNAKRMGLALINYYMYINLRGAVTRVKVNRLPRTRWRAVGRWVRQASSCTSFCPPPAAGHRGQQQGGIIDLGRQAGVDIIYYYNIY